jgi:hypothetical protein
MARNRKHQSAASRFGPALKAVLLCLLIGGCGVGYVWQKDEIKRLGQVKQQRERSLADLVRANELKRQQLEMMRTPQFLQGRIKELNLGLGPTDPSQVWRLPEPARETPPRESGTQYAARNQEGSAVQ